MDVDDILDLASVAVEDVFGRLITYTPAGASPVADPDGRLKADFQEHYELKTETGFATVGAIVPVLDFRSSLLAEFGIRPKRGDRVAFLVGGESRAYRVQASLASAPGSTILILGERT